MAVMEKNSKIITEAQIMNERLLHADMNFFYQPYQTERSLYVLVATGNVDGLEERNPSLKIKGLGTLSKDVLRNIRYHLIVNASNCARACIASGMVTDMAFTLSDLYIQKADVATSISDIEEINYQMMLDYTKRMKEIKEKATGYPPEIIDAIHYINCNLHRELHASDVAKYLNICTSTFSNKFFAITGTKFNPYVEERRINLAKHYLRFTNLPVSEIASNLAFCSQSYFSTRFKENVGITPLQFRKVTENENMF